MRSPRCADSPATNTSPIAGVCRAGCVCAARATPPREVCRMDLAIFDVDGTLTRTTQLDGTCFVRAVAAVIGAVPFSTDWRDYTHITDSGITAQIFRDQLGRAPHDQEMTDVQQRFMDLLVES